MVENTGKSLVISQLNNKYCYPPWVMVIVVL